MKIKTLVLVNFKTYPESVGEKALPLAKKLSKIKKPGYTIAVAPSMLTLKELAQKASLPVFSQHCDHIPLGAHTGRISSKEIRQIKAQGTILNHSERKIPLKYLKGIIEVCRQNHLITVVCAASLPEIRRIARFNPNFIAYEPKELIGSNISVTEAHPEIITKAVETVRRLSPNTKVLCGAGIHTKEDVAHALDLGAQGILIAHAIVQAEDPKKFLESMLP